MPADSSFVEIFGLLQGGVVSIVGAGGKTSLMFHLAAEARAQGCGTFVSTTTKMLIPCKDQYDELDLSGNGFIGTAPISPGIYVAGIPISPQKMKGLSDFPLNRNSALFDVTLLEADGAAKKALKGWLASEPVIPAITTHTIGVVDISTVGQVIDEELVHRLDCFNMITGAEKGGTVTVDHLNNMITHENGLFYRARGKRIVFINKAESEQNISDAYKLMALLSELDVYAGSIKKNTIMTKQVSL